MFFYFYVNTDDLSISGALPPQSTPCAFVPTPTLCTTPILWTPYTTYPAICVSSPTRLWHLLISNYTPQYASDRTVTTGLYVPCSCVSATRTNIDQTHIKTSYAATCFASSYAAA